MRIKSCLCILIIILFFGFVPGSRILSANELKTEELRAKAAVLIDGTNNRKLFGKNENEILPMASTTKIMTLVIALENGNPDDKVTFSRYAASQPDVQLNAKAGEQYYLKDLLYIMMLRSYNDVAVAIAEHIGAESIGEKTEAENRDTNVSRKCVQAFAGLMNRKAKELGCENTYFITPNGLDATDDTGTHSTTAYELAVIAAYAISREEVENICTTESYSCSELNGKRYVDITTTDAFLNMVKGAVGMKTGFTGNAGYCFVGAVRQNERVFISVVLGCGWPPNKTYKWVDTKLLMNYAIESYFTKKVLIKDKNFRRIPVSGGKKEYVTAVIDDELTMLLSDDENIQVLYNVMENTSAPVLAGDKLGQVDVYIDDKLYESYPVTAKTSVEQTDYMWFLKKICKIFIL